MTQCISTKYWCRQGFPIAITACILTIQFWAGPAIRRRGLLPDIAFKAGDGANATSFVNDALNHSAELPSEVRPRVTAATANLRTTFAQFVSDLLTDSNQISNTAAFNNTIRQRPPPLCSRNDIIDGAWVPVTLPRAPYFRNHAATQCYSRDAYFNTWSTYQWLPARAAAGQCTFAEFDAGTMCQLLANQTVLLVGDSLTWEQYVSMVHLLSSPVPNTGTTHGPIRLVNERLQFQSWRRQENVMASVCHDSVRLVFLRNDRLTTLDKAIQHDFPTILVLNRGAHYTSDDALLRELAGTVAHVQTWQAECQRRGMTCRFFWRTTVPGHPHCTNFTAPVNNKTQMEDWIGNRSNYDEKAWNGYHWQDMQHQNELVVDMWRRQTNVTHQVLDAYHLNILRPDEHLSSNDCLHSCYPGKVDVYAQLLMHYLSA